MILLSILLGFILEYFLGSLDRVRNFKWFDSFSDWLDSRLGKYPLWNGPAGVLATLAIPLLLLYAIVYQANSLWVVAGFIIATLVFIYSLGSDLNTMLNRYVEALESGDEGRISGLEQKLEITQGYASGEARPAIQALILRAHAHIFAVVFWFILLGPVGGLLISLAEKIQRRFDAIHGGYADAARNLYQILIWPSTRVLAVGFALGGSLVDALDGWRRVQGHPLDTSEEIVSESGIGALQLGTRVHDTDDEEQSLYITQIQDAQALLNRTLIIWLTVVGLLTLGGILR